MTGVLEPKKLKPGWFGRSLKASGQVIRNDPLGATMLVFAPIALCAAIGSWVISVVVGACLYALTTSWVALSLHRARPSAWTVLMRVFEHPTFVFGLCAILGMTLWTNWSTLAGDELPDSYRVRIMHVSIGTSVFMVQAAMLGLAASFMTLALFLVLLLAGKPRFVWVFSIWAAPLAFDHRVPILYGCTLGAEASRINLASSGLIAAPALLCFLLPLGWPLYFLWLVVVCREMFVGPTVVERRVAISATVGIASRAGATAR